jgi:predicted MFS family arabinose efflux permease
VAAITITWTLGAVLVSGQPGRRDPAFIAVGVTMVAASVGLAIHAVPHGPLWLIVACAALEGFGYGMAWSFILRRNLQFVSPDEADRLSAAQPTIGRLGYALGAAVTGIFANVAGFHSGASMAEAQGVARMIFLGSLPFALLAWVAMIRFVTTRRQGS